MKQVMIKSDYVIDALQVENSRLSLENAKLQAQIREMLEENARAEQKNITKGK